MELKADFSRTFPGGMTVAGNFSLSLGAFSVTILFGASGCGKTTLLRCLAGLEVPDAGRIRAGDEVWFDADGEIRLPAFRRGIGFVTQEPLLFPHLPVAGNIAFGLAGLSRTAKADRVAEMCALVGLEGLEARRPGALSGGQKQRVALARALAPRPRLVLLDEPFASLDGEAAELLRHGLRRTLQVMGVPALLVTHDPAEALALGDRMLRMAGGRIVQEGTPQEVLSRANAFPEELRESFVRVTVSGHAEGLVRLSAGEAELFAPDPGRDFRQAYACIRSEGVSLERQTQGLRSPRNRLQAQVLTLEEQGPLTRVRLDAGFPLEAMITTWAREDLHLQPGDRVQALIKASAIRVVPLED